MKRTSILLKLIVLLAGQIVLGAATPISNQPDSVYLFIYATTKNSNTNDLHFAWSNDQKNWTSIGSEMRFLFCDCERWGVEKCMITPFLFRAPDGCGTAFGVWTSIPGHLRTLNQKIWFTGCRIHCDEGQQLSGTRSLTPLLLGVYPIICSRWWKFAIVIFKSGIYNGKQHHNKKHVAVILAV